MNIELPPEASQFVEDLVAFGRYQSANEAVAHAVELLMARHELGRDIQKGVEELEAGRGIEGRVVFSGLREQVKRAGGKAE